MTNNIIVCMYSDILLWHSICTAIHSVHSKIQYKMLLKNELLYFYMSDGFWKKFVCNSKRANYQTILNKAQIWNACISDFWQLLRKINLLNWNEIRHYR